MKERLRQDQTSLEVEASNAGDYERRQRDRRAAPPKAETIEPPRRKGVQREVWWVVVASIMMAMSLGAVLWVSSG